MLGFLKKLLGTKSEKDVKELQPIVDKVAAIYPSLAALSNEQLRARVADMKQKIKDAYKAEDDKITAIKNRLEVEIDIDVDTKEGLYKEIDDIEKDITKLIEEVLKDIQAEAFAVCKETARRFTENTELSVVASEIDTFYLINYAFIKPKPITIPAVSVLRTLSPKRANINQLSIIFDLSPSDQPPSGQTQRAIFCKES